MKNQLAGLGLSLLLMSAALLAGREEIDHAEKEVQSGEITRYCMSCHDGAVGPAIHLESTHPVDTGGVTCLSCHVVNNQKLGCLDCHEK